MMEFKVQDDRTNITGWEGVEVSTCSCIPSCVQIRYGKQMSSSKLDDSFQVKKEFLVGRDPAYFK